MGERKNTSWKKVSQEVKRITNALSGGIEQEADKETEERQGKTLAFE